MAKHYHRIVGLALGILLAATPARAQQLAGQVVEDGTDRPIEGVHVVLLDIEGRNYGETFTDETGAFSLTIPRHGNWVLAADHLGYGSVESDPIEVDTQDRMVIEIRMDIDAVPVDPVVVKARVAHRSADLERFYARAERGEASGLGHFVTREEIDRSMASEASQLLRTMPGVRVTNPNRPNAFGNGNVISMAGGCIPAIYVDGTQINRFGGSTLDNFVPAASIEGIEVYRGSGQQVGPYLDRRGCGLILVWTRRGSPDSGPFTWGKLLVGASLLLGVLAIQ